ncbi:membrane fusion protein (multidrug efflux system) [Sporomusaceae bacterium BoRhaA]|uniref:efflux RND transporter periplasmic adaptor subunit n=1 Tax=Pelorhabdus rhamnosifermentans TaxID=2772457 RepID=UPI001C061543|nr:efflux RND transporter periplasmic adaptor subunit [Pelorhabdus rhamnosifermentans]MBU2700847.1 membrane fusion protein (multidrug efflux system) [Pelorhabdus rhamnosifermentans]
MEEILEVEKIAYFNFNRKWYLVCLLLVVLLVSGCGQKPQMGPKTVEVKAMQVIQQDTPITYDFVGQVVAKNEVKVQAKVSGNIVAKMVNGGDFVQQGQSLFEIDNRQTNAALLTARAQLAQSQAALSNSQLDAQRYQQLAAQNAISQQTADQSASAATQNEAAVEANQAKVQQAEADLQDSVIVAPIDGRIDTNDLSIGSFVTAGATTMATLSSIDPVFVQFSMSENEYLKFAQRGNGGSPSEWFGELTLVLSNGTQYPLRGRVTQVDRGMAQDTGTLTIKATFDNPQHMLVPGMFARIVAQGETIPGALLVPERAVQQLLGKSFVTVVGEGDKAESRPVTLGQKVNGYWVVQEGLTAGDRVVVDGTQKAQPGTSLSITMIGPEELQAPAQQ